MEMKDLMARIGYFRNKANLSAKALSLLINKNPAYITKMEHGEYEPSMQVMLDIINACGTTPEEFFYPNISDFTIDKELLNLLKNTTQTKKWHLDVCLS